MEKRFCHSHLRHPAGGIAFPWEVDNYSSTKGTSVQAETESAWLWNSRLPSSGGSRVARNQAGKELGCSRVLPLSACLLAPSFTRLLPSSSATTEKESVLQQRAWWKRPFLVMGGGGGWDWPVTAGNTSITFIDTYSHMYPNKTAQEYSEYLKHFLKNNVCMHSPIFISVNPAVTFCIHVPVMFPFQSLLLCLRFAQRSQQNRGPTIMWSCIMATQMSLVWGILVHGSFLSWTLMSTCSLPPLQYLFSLLLWQLVCFFPLTSITYWNNFCKSTRS